MGTNKPVRITDAKSGLIRRLIDVSPTGDKVEPNEYKTIMKHIPFELGPIAYHCQEVYLEDPAYYDGYIPIAMLGASNDFYNYIVDSYPVFKREDGTSLKAAWEMYKTYNEEAKVAYPLSQRAFKEELKNYFHDYLDITAPLYWWKEFDTYKVGTVANSCSTMHKITDKPFELDDFSHEHLMAFPEACEFMGELDENVPDEASLNLDVSTFKNRSNLLSPWFLFTMEVQALNQYRNLYLRIKNKPTKDLKKKEENLKKIWWQMIQLIPSSYNQKRTVMLNYEVLANIYKSRRHHKLDEWHTLCNWIESLPYSKLITGTAV